MSGHRRHHDVRHTSDPDESPFPGAVDRWAPGARHGEGAERPGDFDRDTVLENWSRDAAAATEGEQIPLVHPVADLAANANRALASIDDLRQELTVAGASAERAACPDLGYPHHPELACVLRTAQLFAERAATTAEEQAHRVLSLVDEIDRLNGALGLFTRRNEELVRELRRLSHTLTAHTPSRLDV
jgi:hypothetical protein